MIWPPLTTKIWSALRIVESLCAMTKLVRPSISFISAAWISISVPVSTDEVASSRIRIEGLARITLAMDSSWRWPWEKFSPLSSSIVS